MKLSLFSLLLLLVPLTDGISLEVRNQTVPAPRSIDQQQSQVESLRFKRESIIIGDHRAFVLWPHRKKRNEPQPWIMYAPVLAKYPDAHENWLFNRLADAGIAVAGVDVGESYGSPRGCRAFTELYNRLTKDYRFAAKPCLLARSRGGLWASAWAIENPDKVAGIAGIYPVFDLRSYPGLKKASRAYGMSESEFANSLANHNPIMKADSLAKKEIPILLVHGDADQIVPLAENSQELVQVYENLDASKLIQLKVAAGQGHTDWRGYFQNQSMLKFLVENSTAAATCQK